MIFVDCVDVICINGMDIDVWYKIFSREMLCDKIIEFGYIKIV